MCVEYDTGVAKSCREPIAEEVRDKEHANFCDYFKPRPQAYTPRNEAEIAKSRGALDALFGKSPGTAPAAGSESPGDAARTKLDDLFKK
jgi:hypothetical protein